jgi:hypothetical protein
MLDNPISAAKFAKLVSTRFTTVRDLELNTVFRKSYDFSNSLDLKCKYKTKDMKKFLPLEFNVMVSFSDTEEEYTNRIRHAIIDKIASNTKYSIKDYLCTHERTRTR